MKQNKAKHCTYNVKQYTLLEKYFQKGSEAVQIFLILFN